MKMLIRKIARRLALLQQLKSTSDWVLFLQLFVFALFVPAFMRLGVRRLSALLSQTNRPAKELSAKTLPVDAKKMITLTDLAMEFGSPLIDKRCLTRGITLYYFLRRAGMPVELHFGVAPVGTALNGHCWLVQNEQPFAEPIDPRSRFAEVWSMPIKV